ncbi:MAG: hypothetical protein H6779_01995 [Candidatus Nomurabacteria bacterium]|nr:hypothetical protein [Candidatus Nomurabacteria bacterium]USN88196.1 MAG: hypothetical protein H6779_01995 [Candidatus Nomurabacteria bacterium]
MKKIIMITLVAVLAIAVSAFIISDNNQETEVNTVVSNPVEETKSSQKSTYTSNEIGITFTYDKRFGQPKFLDFSKYCTEIKASDDRICQNFQILFGGDNSNLADVAIFAVNKVRLESNELSQIGKEGVAFPWPPTESMSMDDECFVPGVPNYSNGKCEYVTKNNILMRHTYLDVQNTINDFPRYEYSFYVPDKDLGVVIYTKEHDSENHIDFIERITESLSLN